MACLLPSLCMALIPAMNEEATVAEVVRQLKSAGVRWVRVVDNGSTDDTGPAARRAGAEVIAEPRRGYGRACWTGLLDGPAVDAGRMPVGAVL